MNDQFTERQLARALRKAERDGLHRARQVKKMMKPVNTRLTERKAEVHRVKALQATVKRQKAKRLAADARLKERQAELRRARQEVYAIVTPAPPVPRCRKHFFTTRRIADPQAHALAEESSRPLPL